MKKILRRIFVGSGILFGLMIFSLFAALFFFETDMAQQYVRAKINKAIPGKVSWKQVRVSLIRGSLEVGNAELRSPDDEELITLDKLDLRFSPAHLLRGELRAYRLTLNRPIVNLRHDRDGKLKLSSAFPHSTHKEETSHDSGGGMALNISAENIEASDGAVYFGTWNRSLTAEIEDIRVVGSGNLSQLSADAEITVGRASFENPHLKADLRSFRTKGSIRKRRIDLSELGISIDADYKDKLGAGRIDLNCRLDDRIVFVEPLTLKTFAGDLNLSGQIDFREAFPTGFFTLHPNIEALAYTLKLNGTDIPLANLTAGKARGDVNAMVCLNGKGIFPENMSAEMAAEAFAKGISDGDRVSVPTMSLKAAAGLKQNVLKLDVLEASAGQSNLKAKGDYEFSSDRIHANLSFESQDLGQSLSPFGIADVKGDAKADITLSGLLRNPVSELTLLGNKLRFGDMVIGDADIAASMDWSRSLKVSRLLIRNQGSEIRGGGSIRVFDTDLDSDFSLVLSKIRIGNFFRKEYVKGLIEARLDMKGNPRKPSAELSLNGKDLESGNVRIGNLGLSASLNPNGMVTVSGLSLDNKGSTIKGGGKIRIFRDGFRPHPDMPLELSLELRNVESKNFWDKALFRGSVEGKFDASGNVRMPDIALSLHGKGVGFESVRLGDIDADLKFSKGEVKFDTLKLRHSDSAADISGFARIMEKDRLKLLKSPSFDLTISGDRLRLGDYAKDFEGLLSLNAHLEGTPEHPRGNIRLKGRKVDLGVQKFSEIALKSELADDKININSLMIGFAPGESIEGSGWLSFAKTFEIALKSGGISLSAIDKLKDRKDIGGTVALDLKAGGSFDNPSVSGNISPNALKIGEKPLRDMRFDIDLKHHVATIRGKPGFDLEARFDIGKKDFSTVLRFSDTDLTPYFDIAGQNGFHGQVNGRIEASGNALDPARIRAMADLSGLNVSFRDMEIVRADELKVSFGNNELSIPSTRLKVMRTGNVAISGKAKPDGSGALEIELRNIGFPIPELEQNLHDLNGKIRITPERIGFEDIRAGLDTGTLELSGNIALARFRPVSADLRLTANALPLKVPNTLDMLFNADLKLSGTPEKTSVQGETIIVEGRYYRNVNLSLLNMVKGVKEKKREIAEFRQQRPQFSQPFLKNMNFDISVKRRNPFMVDNNLAKLEVHPDLKIHGTLNKPLISGRAEVPSGTITYQKRKFDLKRGFIDFINPYEIEPTLDIEGSATIRKWTVSLKVTGTPDNLSFKLGSVPSEEDGDILSLMLIGKTTRELIENEGGNSQAPAQMLAQLVAETIGEDFKKATGLDIFQVDFQEQDAKKSKNNNGNGVKVTVGKELSRRMVLKYAVESKEGQTIQKAIAEYKFLENILVSGFQDSKGGFGGELQFRLEYR